MRTARPVLALPAPLFALTAACGGDAADTSADPAAPTASAGPIVLEHAFGSTRLASTPERVVSVGFTDQDALGVEPVGVREWFGDQPLATWPWAQDELGDAEPAVLPSAALAFEQIAALEPDLIVGVSSGMTEEDYTKLSQIAPTLARPKEFVDFGTPWQDATGLIGEAVGEPDRAEELVEELETRFAQATENNPALVGKTATFGIMFDKSTVSAYGPQDARGRLLTDLGMQLPQPVVTGAGDSFFAGFSSEQLQQIDGDALVWGDFGDSEEFVRALPLRPRLDVVQNGGEIFLDEQENGAASFGTVLSLPALLDTLVPKLAAAVDGDPSTAVPGSSASPQAG